jgi:DNA-binding response OmpR family regulator
MRLTTILLVEDDPNDVLFLKTAFEETGLENTIREVADGRQALEYLSGAGQYADRTRFPLPYLILLDLKLPYLMGLEVLKWIRERALFDSTVVLILTASSDRTDVDTAYRLGANGFLVKTSRFDSLVAMMKSIQDFWLVHNRPGSAFADEEGGEG